jgi:hypothetical protein
MDYLKSLHEMKQLLKKFIGSEHSVKLYYRYSKSNDLFRKGNYFVDGKVLKVNISNLKYWHQRTMAYINEEHSYIDLGPRPEIDRYIALDRYLWKVTISASKLKISPFDEGRSTEKLLVL